MAWWRRSRPVEQPPAADVAAELRRVASEHLDAATAEQWTDLLRPTVWLEGAGRDEPLLARTGGVPLVPPGFEWPRWEGRGALPFVGEVDLAALAASGLDPGIHLPATGRLLAFFYDGPGHGDPDGTVGVWDTATLAGARLLHVDGDPATFTPATVPAGVMQYAEDRLVGRQGSSYPGFEHPAVTAFEDDLPDALWEAAEEVVSYGSDTRIGGWAASIQYPVECEADDGEPDGLRSRLVLQVGSTDAMMWGDMGSLFWLAPAADLPRLDEVGFTWQT